MRDGIVEVFGDQLTIRGPRAGGSQITVSSEKGGLLKSVMWWRGGRYQYGM